MNYPDAYSSIGDAYKSRQTARSTVISKSNKALKHAKQAIFALHRKEEDVAKKHLQNAEDLFEKVEELFEKHPSLRYQGAYNAALEEYAEAHLFLSYIQNRTLDQVPERAQRWDAFLGGLSDACGEITRFATRNVTQGNYEEVDKAQETVEQVVAFLLELDLTGKLRNKFDQARSRLRRLEGMAYDLHLRENKT